MPKIKKPVINYTSREFATIKEDLLNYAQKYYPEAFQDFNEASFGSLMVDMVSYIGDMLSFYIDYQANESFLETAQEFTNVLKLSKQTGFKYKPNASSHGQASFFISVPVLEDSVAPDMTYAPVLRRGSTFLTGDGKAFTLAEDVDFSESSDIVVANSNEDGTSPTDFAIKAKGLVVSGELVSESFEIGSYERFLKIFIEDPNLTEVVSVFDSNGNNYYEVDYLTQDTIYVPILNTNANRDSARNILKPISVPRRFVVEQSPNSTMIQFGYGTNNNDQELLDPAKVILDIFGKKYITDKSFDPSVLIKTDKMGVVPTDTIVTVLYRRNTVGDTNTAVNTLTAVSNADIKFMDADTLALSKIGNVRKSLEVTNEQPIVGDVTNISMEELKNRAYGTYSAQNRAVTKDDYISMIYNMPANFGQVKRATITRDTDSFNGKNLNLYIISADSDEKLISTNDTIKQNLRTWINKYKMLGDTIDILDAVVLNLEIEFEVIAFANVNKHEVLETCIDTLANYYRDAYYDIGEPFKITDIYKILNNIDSVVDTTSVVVRSKFGGKYSNVSIPVEEMISGDGRQLVPPHNYVFEIKFPSVDIDGAVI